MPYYKFKKNDLFYNRVETHPKCEFWMYNGSVTYNNKPHLTGTLSLPTIINEEATLGAGSNITLDVTAQNPEIFVEVGASISIPEGATLTIEETDINYPIAHAKNGDINLYELNIDRDISSNANLLKLNLDPVNLIYPFVTKEGSLTSFKTVTTTNFNKDFQYGDVMSGSYPLAAGISKERYAQGADRTYIKALKNTLNYYTYLSLHYAYSSASLPHVPSTSPLVGWDKDDQEIGLLSIPSIFYGSSIKKGTVDLQFFITGTMIGRLQDEKRNGELIQVEPKGSTNSGSVAGVVLYNEGFIVLTGSWDLRDATGVSFPGSVTTSNYIADDSDKKTSQWIYFGQSISGSVLVPEASFFMAFSGTTYTPVITMLAHAKRGDLNYSNNPTFIQQGQTLSPTTSSFFYKQPKSILPKNTVSSSFCNYNTPYRKQTFISRVGIYDEDKNLIGIAKMATPVRKLEDDDYTFKLKLDI